MSKANSRNKDRRRIRRIVNQLDRPFMSTGMISRTNWGDGLHRSNVSRELRALENDDDRDPDS